MNLVPPMAPDRVQIADEAINRVASNGPGIYTREKSMVAEKEVEVERDERDIRKKQVR